MGKLVTLRNMPGHPASDGQLVDALLSCGNGVAVQFVRDYPKTFDENSGGRLGSSVQITATLNQEAKSWLEELVADPAQVAMRLISSDAIPTIRACKVSLVVGLGTQGIKRGIFLDLPNLRVALQYAMLVLLDDALPYGRMLCRCRLKSCAIFYLATKNPKGGPPNRNYCTPEHLRIANDSKSKRAPKPSTASASKLRKRKEFKS